MGLIHHIRLLQFPMTPATIKDTVSIDDIEKLDIRVGSIISVDEVEKSDKLMKLTVDFGDHQRSILAGVKKLARKSTGNHRQASFVCSELTATQDGRRIVRGHVVRHWLCRWADPLFMRAGI